MMRYKAKFILMLGVIWLILPRAVSADQIGIINVSICDKRVNNGDSLVLRYKDLKEGKINVRGEAADTLNAQAVEVSLDEGENWIRLNEVSPWEYEFVSQTAKENIFLARVLDKNGNKSPNFLVVIRPDTQELVPLFEGIFKDMRDVYIDERLREFLGYFDKDAYPNFTAFSENMENTFDQSSNFNLKILIRNVALDNDTALVRVDWIKTYEDVSRDSGANNVIRFRKQGGAWKIMDVEDEKIFIVGTGTFRGNITDR